VLSVCTVFSRENYAPSCAHLEGHAERAMSVQADRERWVVRWRDGSGRQRGRRFESEAAARAFDAGLRALGRSLRFGGLTSSHA
jgi:hypothetical protein